MGNTKSKHAPAYATYNKDDDAYTEKLLNEKLLKSNTSIKNLENAINDLQSKLNIVMITLDNLQKNIDSRFNKFEKLVDQNKKQCTDSNNNLSNNLNDKIKIMGKDMNSLLTNDKLLLEKLMDNKMLSTIDESVNQYISSHDDEFKSEVQPFITTTSEMQNSADTHIHTKTHTNTNTSTHTGNHANIKYAEKYDLDYE